METGPKYNKVLIFGFVVFASLALFYNCVSVPSTQGPSFRHIVRQLNQLNEVNNGSHGPDTDWAAHYSLAVNALQHSNLDIALNESEAILAVVRTQNYKLQVSNKGEFDSCMRELAAKIMSTRSLSETSVGVLPSGDAKRDKLDKLQVAEKLLRAALQWGAVNGRPELRSQLNLELENCLSEQRAL